MAGGIIVFACNENPCSGCFTLLIFYLDWRLETRYQIYSVIACLAGQTREVLAVGWPDIPTIMSTDHLAAAAAAAG